MSGYNPINTTSGSADTAPAGGAKINGMAALKLGTKLVATPGAGPLNDYDPTGAGTLGSGNNSRVDMNPSANTVINGILATGINDEKVVKFRNISGFTITWNHQNTGSAAANRINVPGQVAYVQQKGETVVLEYWSSGVGTDTCWVLRV